MVHDRYQNYDSFDGISHQLCIQHLLRDLEDAAQSYPQAIWPRQIARQLRALIHAANLARGQGLAVAPDEAIAGHLRLFRHGVNAGLSAVRRVPGATRKQPHARHLLECFKRRGQWRGGCTGICLAWWIWPSRAATGRSWWPRPGGCSCWDVTTR